MVSRFSFALNQLAEQEVSSGDQETCAMELVKKERRERLKQAKEYLDSGEIQEARLLIAGLASEMVIELVNIPLTTYPVAIKAVVPLIDKGDFAKAREALHAALNTLA